MELHFREIERIEDPALPDYLDLYETAFPPRERVPVSDILRLLLARQQGEPQANLLVAALDAREELAGMAWLDVETKCAAGYLIYMAVVADRRGGGIGSRLFAELVRLLRVADPQAQALLFEVEDPEHCEEPERILAERRITFYRRLGARLLGGIHYLQTVPFYPEGMSMRIAALPLGELTAERAFEIAQCLFGEAITRTPAPLTLD
jgi:GNAT superfamily N-acetyltransferase